MGSSQSRPGSPSLRWPPGGERPHALSLPLKGSRMPERYNAKFPENRQHCPGTVHSAASPTRRTSCRRQPRSGRGTSQTRSSGAHAAWSSFESRHSRCPRPGSSSRRPRQGSKANTPMEGGAPRSHEQNDHLPVVTSGAAREFQPTFCVTRSAWWAWWGRGHRGRRSVALRCSRSCSFRRSRSRSRSRRRGCRLR